MFTCDVAHCCASIVIHYHYCHSSSFFLGVWIKIDSTTASVRQCGARDRNNEKKVDRLILNQKETVMPQRFKKTAPNETSLFRPSYITFILCRICSFVQQECLNASASVPQCHGFQKYSLLYMENRWCS